MPDYFEEYPNMLDPPLPLPEHGTRGFVFRCATGQIFGDGGGDAVAFSWAGEWKRSTRPRATGGPTFSPTVPSGEISASLVATNLTSSPSETLLQQPC